MRRHSPPTIVFLFKTSQHLAARTAGASRRLSKKPAQGGPWLLAGVVWLSLAMSAMAESLQTETMEPDASAVSDSDASREPWYYGKKGLTYDPEGSTNPVSYTHLTLPTTPYV